MNNDNGLILKIKKRLFCKVCQYPFPSRIWKEYYYCELCYLLLGGNVESNEINYRLKELKILNENSLLNYLTCLIQEVKDQILK